MPQVKGAMMVSKGDIKVSTTSGHVIEFKANVEQYVPPLAVRECIKFGAREVKRYKGTATHIPGATSKGRITSEVVAPELDQHIIEEDFLPEDAPDTTAPSIDEDTDAHRSGKVFTETEQRVRKAITAMLTDSTPTEWTSALIPVVSKLNNRVEDMTVTSSLRDRVWQKMEEAGEIPESYAEDLGLV